MCKLELMTRGNAAELLDAIDRALDRVAPTMSGAVEVGLATPGALARDHRPDAAPAQAAPRGRAAVALVADGALRDRKSTRLNSSHANISYAVFCLKKKKQSVRSNV